MFWLSFAQFVGDRRLKTQGMNAATLLPLFGILLAVCVNPGHTSTCPGGEHFSAWLPTRACTHHIKDVVRLVCHSFPSSLLEATGEKTIYSIKFSYSAIGPVILNV